jgi:hypothetical protein
VFVAKYEFDLPVQRLAAAGQRKGAVEDEIKVRSHAHEGRADRLLPGFHSSEGQGRISNVQDINSGIRETGDRAVDVVVFQGGVEAVNNGPATGRWRVWVSHGK